MAVNESDLKSKIRKNVHNFFMSLLKMNWASDHVAEILLIVIKPPSDLISRGQVLDMSYVFDWIQSVADAFSLSSVSGRLRGHVMTLLQWQV